MEKSDRSALTYNPQVTHVHTAPILKKFDIKKFANILDNNQPSIIDLGHNSKMKAWIENNNFSCLATPEGQVTLRLQYGKSVLDDFPLANRPNAEMTAWAENDPLSSRCFVSTTGNMTLRLDKPYRKAVFQVAISHQGTSPTMCEDDAQMIINLDNVKNKGTINIYQKSIGDIVLNATAMDQVVIDKCTFLQVYNPLARMFIEMECLGQQILPQLIKNEFLTSAQKDDIENLMNFIQALNIIPKEKILIFANYSTGTINRKFDANHLSLYLKTIGQETFDTWVDKFTMQFCTEYEKVAKNILLLLLTKISVTPAKEWIECKEKVQEHKKCIAHIRPVTDILLQHIQWITKMTSDVTLTKESVLKALVELDKDASLTLSMSDLNHPTYDQDTLLKNLKITPERLKNSSIHIAVSKFNNTIIYNKYNSHSVLQTINMGYNHNLQQLNADWNNDRSSTTWKDYELRIIKDYQVSRANKLPTIFELKPQFEDNKHSVSQIDMANNVIKIPNPYLNQKLLISQDVLDTFTQTLNKNILKCFNPSEKYSQQDELKLEDQVQLNKLQYDNTSPCDELMH